MSESPSLSYASRVPVMPQVALYRIALACAVVPQAVGLITLALYAYDRWEVLWFVGLYTLIGGFVLLLIGLVCLLIFRYGLRGCDPAIAAAWRRRAKWTGLFLFLNLPVAFLCVVVGVNLATQYIVVVRNTSAFPVSSISLTSPGDNELVQTLAPGETRRVYLNIDNDGEVSFSANQSGSTVKGTVDGYVTIGGLGRRATLTFTPAGPVIAN